MVDFGGLAGEVVAELQAVSQIAGDLWKREWAERNAGNISIDFSDHFSLGKHSPDSPFVPYAMPASLAGYTLFVSGKGCYLRSLTDKIDEAGCILQINADASAYQILWGGKSSGFKPSSEMITHLKIHHFNTLHRPDHKVVLHTHPTELIVLSHNELFEREAAFNQALWKMCPEISLFVPDGVCCAPYAITGSEALAEVTIHGLKTRNVILWEKHGALATGSTINSAFDFIDVANKGAKMLLMAWAAGFEPKGLSTAQLKALEKLR